MLKRTISLGLASVLIFVFGLCFKVSAQQQAVKEELNLKPTVLNVTIGLFDHFDKENGALYVALDKKRTKLEKIDTDQIRAVFLIQGNNGKLLKYVFGGAGGGAGIGFGTLIAKNRAMATINGTESKKLETGQVLTWTSVAAAVGAVAGYLMSDKEVNEVRMFRIYDLEVEQVSTSPDKINYRDRGNLEKIPEGSFIQVVMALPGD